jgi:carboxymethylenebutenolidase
MERTRFIAACVLSTFVASAARASDEWLTAMAHQHEGDAPVAGAAAEAAASAVAGRDIAYATLDGAPVTGYLAPAKASAEVAIIVIQEWWGLNDNIRAMARELAGAGYTALAVDLYEGKTATDSAGAQALMEAALGTPERLLDNLRQAHQYLTQTLGATRVGVVGWCFGGGWSLQTALALGDGIDAAVVYYGRVETDPEKIGALAAPVLGHFGTLDQGTTLESARAFETAARAAGKDVTIHAYEGADHAFANPSGTRYQPEPARLAWERTLEFFARHLGGE